MLATRVRTNGKTNCFPRVLARNRTSVDVDIVGRRPLNARANDFRLAGPAVQ